MPADVMRQRYLELLKTHDWSYEYSDDTYAYLRGKTRHNEILELAKHIDPTFALYNEHAPEDYRK